MVDPDSSFCAFGAAILQKHFSAFQAEIEGVRKAEDIECIHRMRVASRRLRSALPLFGACFGSKTSQRWIKETKQITQALGAARDADVQIDLLNSIIHNLPDAIYAPGMRRILLRRKQTRLKLQAKVLKSLDKMEQDGVILEIGAQTSALSNLWDPTYPFSHASYEIAALAIQTNLKDIFSHEQYIYAPENILELHAMRVAVKKLRYTLEIFTPLYSDIINKSIQTARQFQDLLGEIHDCDVWITELPGFQEQEMQRVQDYFGNIGPYKRLVPGFDFFNQERRGIRQQKYEKFISAWSSIKENQLWENLMVAIQRPLSFGEPSFHKTSSPPAENAQGG